MKKKYRSPELEIVLLETERAVMANSDSYVDPDPFLDQDDERDMYLEIH